MFAEDQTVCTLFFGKVTTLTGIKSSVATNVTDKEYPFQTFEPFYQLIICFDYKYLNRSFFFQVIIATARIQKNALLFVDSAKFPPRRAATTMKQSILVLCGTLMFSSHAQVKHAKAKDRCTQHWRGVSSTIVFMNYLFRYALKVNHHFNLLLLQLLEPFLCYIVNQSLSQVFFSWNEAKDN